MILLPESTFKTAAAKIEMNTKKSEKKKERSWLNAMNTSIRMARIYLVFAKPDVDSISIRRVFVRQP